jgi:hypothetical protein
MDIRVAVYTNTSDYNKFHKIKQELLKIIDIIKECGTELTLPENIVN